MHTAALRALFMLVQQMCFPLLVLFSIKIFSWMLKRVPALKAIRLSAERLQRIARLRRQEVRRMTEAGHDYVLRQKSKRETDQALKDVLSRMASHKVTAEKPAVKGDVDGDGKVTTADFMAQLRAKKAAGSSGSDLGSELTPPGGAPGNAEPAPGRAPIPSSALAFMGEKGCLARPFGGRPGSAEPAPKSVVDKYAAKADKPVGDAYSSNAPAPAAIKGFRTPMRTQVLPVMSADAASTSSTAAAAATSKRCSSLSSTDATLAALQRRSIPQAHRPAAGAARMLSAKPTSADSC